MNKFIMDDEIVKFATSQVFERLGLPVNGVVSSDADGKHITLKPAGDHPNESFSIRLDVGWRSAEVSFLPGRFAGSLIKSMGVADEEGRCTFVTYASAAKAKSIKISMRINDSVSDPLHPETWSRDWMKLELLLGKYIDGNDDEQIKLLVIDLFIPIFGMIVSLVGTIEEETTLIGDHEGTPFQSIITRYERKKVNRDACIQFKGTRCVVCGFDFFEFYGSIGYGYIEVHHVTPVSSMGAGYVINVMTDLEPLCSNCHSMVHKSNPPIPIEDLKSIVNSRKMKE